MGCKDIHNPLEVAIACVALGDAVPAGAERRTGALAKGAKGIRGQLPGVVQGFVQGAQNAVATCVDGADLGPVPGCRLDDAGGGGVDHGGDTAGLGIEGVGHARSGSEAEGLCAA